MQLRAIAPFLIPAIELQIMNVIAFVSQSTSSAISLNLPTKKAIANFVYLVGWVDAFETQFIHRGRSPKSDRNPPFTLSCVVLKLLA